MLIKWNLTFSNFNHYFNFDFNLNFNFNYYDKDCYLSKLFVVFSQNLSFFLNFDSSFKPDFLVYLLVKSVFLCCIVELTEFKAVLD